MSAITEMRDMGLYEMPLCCLPTPMTLASGGGGESNVTTCGPPANFSVHLASSAVTPPLSVSLLDFGIGTMLANFHV